MPQRPKPLKVYANTRLVLNILRQHPLDMRGAAYSLLERRRASCRGPRYTVATSKPYHFNARRRRFVLDALNGLPVYTSATTMDAAVQRLVEWGVARHHIVV
jgi:hypothetical protein